MFKEMEKICQYRFGVEYCAFHMSDKFLSPEEIVRHMKIVSHPIEEKTMLTTLHALRELGVTVWNIEKLGDDTVIDNILSNLQNKPETMET